MMNPGKMSARNVLLVILFILAIVPLLTDDAYYLHILITVYLYAILAGAWNIVGGYAGQISFAHAAFFGIGAYTSSILYLSYKISPWIGLFAAIGVSTVVCLIISYPTLRLRGPFFVLVTLAFLQVSRILATHFRGITKGSEGLQIPYKPAIANMMFEDKVVYLYLFFILLAITLIVTYYIENSKLGYRLLALREDNDAAETLGVNTTRVRITAACISAMLTGAAGVLYAQYALFLDPEGVFSLNVNTQMILMTIIGGAGTLFGPLLGAVLLVPLGEFLRGALGDRPGLDQVLYGITLIAVVLMSPDGFVPTLKKYLSRLLFNKNIGSTDRIGG